MADKLANPLRIAIETPAKRGSRTGNRVTALRWAGLLRELGHRVTITSDKITYDKIISDSDTSDSVRDFTAVRGDYDVLIAVHAVKSAAAVLRARELQPNLPIVTLLAGTDIYPKFEPTAIARAAMAEAHALIALQPRAVDALPAELRTKARVMVQSATTVAEPHPKRAKFTAVMLAHLRAIKRPLLAVQAVARVPESVDMQLLLAGSSLDDDYGQQVQDEIARTGRVRWLGERTRRESKELLASSHACLVPSQSEGGANVVSEAIAAGTPVLCSAIPGNTGLLGEDWPGAFAPDDVDAFAKLLTRAASDHEFFDALCQRTAQLQPMVSPAAERAAWQALLAELLPR